MANRIKITENVDSRNSRLADLKRRLTARVVETPKFAYIEEISQEGDCGGYRAKLTLGGHYEAVEVVGFGEEECLTRCAIIIAAFETRGK